MTEQQKKRRPVEPLPLGRERDLPVLLAWIRPSQEPHAPGCSVRGCREPARFTVDSYEDPAVLVRFLEERMRARQVVLDMVLAEEVLCQATHAEQQAGRYVVHEQRGICLRHLTEEVAHFLNTRGKTRDIETLLAAVAAGRCEAVQYHWRLHPDDGLLAITTNGESAEAVVEDLRHGKVFHVWEVQA